VQKVEPGGLSFATASLILSTLTCIQSQLFPESDESMVENMNVLDITSLKPLIFPRVLRIAE